MHALNLLVAVLLTLLPTAGAAIVDIIEFPNGYIYHATNNSTISVSFQTAPTLVIREDYSIVFGIYPVNAYSGAQIGTRFAVRNLTPQQVSSGANNITISGLKLEAMHIAHGSGLYTMAAADTFGNGPGISVGVHVYTTSLNVTV
ncbi:hypothetical protein BKA62DRAFT_724142 [Auriculariales sp. MPI-PUGE-AT-0066]|nr:hypothetical protein BKA62DRAFT_724142 [Auriculariales sp. MPI-PUGE-AT-0066]